MNRLLRTLFIYLLSAQFSFYSFIPSSVASEIVTPSSSTGENSRFSKLIPRLDLEIQRAKDRGDDIHYENTPAGFNVFIGYTQEERDRIIHNKNLKLGAGNVFIHSFFEFGSIGSDNLIKYSRAYRVEAGEKNRIEHVVARELTAQNECQLKYLLAGRIQAGNHAYANMLRSELTEGRFGLMEFEKDSITDGRSVFRGNRKLIQTIETSLKEEIFREFVHPVKSFGNFTSSEAASALAEYSFFDGLEKQEILQTALRPEREYAFALASLSQHILSKKSLNEGEPVRQKAEVLLEQALRLDPENLKHILAMEQCLLNEYKNSRPDEEHLKDLRDKIRVYFEDAYILSGRHFETGENLILILLETGSAKKALEIASELDARDRGTMRSRLLLAQTRVLTGDKEGIPLLANLKAVSYELVIRFFSVKSLSEKAELLLHGIDFVSGEKNNLSQFSLPGSLSSRLEAVLNQEVLRLKKAVHDTDEELNKNEPTVADILELEKALGPAALRLMKQNLPEDFSNWIEELLEELNGNEDFETAAALKGIRLRSLKFSDEKGAVLEASVKSELRSRAQRLVEAEQLKKEFHVTESSLGDLIELRSAFGLETVGELVPYLSYSILRHILKFFRELKQSGQDGIVAELSRLPVESFSGENGMSSDNELRFFLIQSAVRYATDPAVKSQLQKLEEQYSSDQKEKQSFKSIWEIVDLNKTDLEYLRQLPGMNAVSAESLVKHKEIFGAFYRWEDLAFVKGIEPSQIKTLRDYAESSQKGLRFLTLGTPPPFYYFSPVPLNMIEKAIKAEMPLTSDNVQINEMKNRLYSLETRLLEKMKDNAAGSAGLDTLQKELLYFGEIFPSRIDQADDAGIIVESWNEKIKTYVACVRARLFSLQTLDIWTKKISSARILENEEAYAGPVQLLKNLIVYHGMLEKSFKLSQMFQRICDSRYLALQYQALSTQDKDVLRKLIISIEDDSYRDVLLKDVSWFSSIDPKEMILPLREYFEDLNIGMLIRLEMLDKQEVKYLRDSLAALSGETPLDVQKLLEIKEKALIRERKSKEEAEQKAREIAEKKAKVEADQKAREEAEKKVKAEAERKAQEETKKAKAEAEQKAREEAEKKAKAEAERKAQEEAKKAEAEAEQKAREEAEKKAKAEAERKAQEEAKKAKTEAESKARAEAERKAKEEAEQKAREIAEKKAKVEADQKAREEAEKKAKAEAERKAQEEAKKAKADAELKARAEAERKAKEDAEQKAREIAEKKAKTEAEQKAREEAEKKAKAEAERKAQEETKKAKAEAEQKAREEVEKKAKAEAEKVKAEAERKVKEESEQKAREMAEKKAKTEAEQKAREEAEKKAKAEAERKAQEETKKAKAEAEQKAREEVEKKAEAEAELKAREMAEKKAKTEAESKARAEAERKAKEDAEQRALEMAEKKAKAEAEQKAHEESERKAKAEVERKAQEEAKKAKAEAERKAQEEAKKSKAEAERKAKEEAEQKAREMAEKKAKAEAELKAREEAEKEAKAEAERKAQAEAKKSKAEAERKAKEEAEQKAREMAEKKAKTEAEQKAREEAEKKVKTKVDYEAQTESVLNVTGEEGDVLSDAKVVESVVENHYRDELASLHLSLENDNRLSSMASIFEEYLGERIVNIVDKDDEILMITKKSLAQLKEIPRLSDMLGGIQIPSKGIVRNMNGADILVDIIRPNLKNILNFSSNVPEAKQEQIFDWVNSSEPADRKSILFDEAMRDFVIQDFDLKLKDIEGLHLKDLIEFEVSDTASSGINLSQAGRKEIEDFVRKGGKVFLRKNWEILTGPSNYRTTQFFDHIVQEKLLAKKKEVTDEIYTLEIQIKPYREYQKHLLKFTNAVGLTSNQIDLSFLDRFFLWFSLPHSGDLDEMKRRLQREKWMIVLGYNALGQVRVFYFYDRAWAALSKSESSGYLKVSNQLSEYFDGKFSGANILKETDDLLNTVLEFYPKLGCRETFFEKRAFVSKKKADQIISALFKKFLRELNSGN